MNETMSPNEVEAIESIMDKVFYFGYDAMDELVARIQDFKNDEIYGREVSAKSDQVAEFRNEILYGDGSGQHIVGIKAPAPRAIAIGSVPNPTPLTSTRAQRRQQQRDHVRAVKRGKRLAIAAPVASGRELLDTAKYLMTLEQGQFQALMLAVMEARYGVEGRARVAKVMGCEAVDGIALPDESTLWVPGAAANVRKGGRR